MNIVRLPGPLVRREHGMLKDFVVLLDAVGPTAGVARERYLCWVFGGQDGRAGALAGSGSAPLGPVCATSR